MNPEQRLFIVIKYLAVEVFVFLFAAFVWMPGPKRIGIIDGNRTSYDFGFFRCRKDFLYFFCTIFVFDFFGLCFFYDGFDNDIFFRNFILIYGVIDRFGIRIFQIDFDRHERTVFLHNFTGPVFIGKFQTVFIQIEGDHRTAFRFVTVTHVKFRTAVAFPMYGSRTFFIGKSINGYLIGYHKCGIKTKTEMTDDLVFIGFIFVLG